MSQPCVLLLIFAGICLILSIFPLPIRAEVDPALARIVIAAAATVAIAGIFDFVGGFIDGWTRSAGRRPRP
jgi:O-antigen/teichoic acid export membrane protein